MMQTLKRWFNSVQNWFWRSETILWARLQVLVGAVWVALQATDLSPVLNPKWMTYWLIFSGVVTELLRRRGTTPKTVVVADTKDGGGVAMTKSFLADSPNTGT